MTSRHPCGLSCPGLELSRKKPLGKLPMSPKKASLDPACLVQEYHRVKGSSSPGAHPTTDGKERPEVAKWLRPEL